MITKDTVVFVSRDPRLDHFYDSAVQDNRARFSGQFGKAINRVDPLGQDTYQIIFPGGEAWYSASELRVCTTEDLYGPMKTVLAKPDRDPHEWGTRAPVCPRCGFLLFDLADSPFNRATAVDATLVDCECCNWQGWVEREVTVTYRVRS